MGTQITAPLWVAIAVGVALVVVGVLIGLWLSHGDSALDAAFADDATQAQEHPLEVVAGHGQVREPSPYPAPPLIQPEGPRDDSGQLMAWPVLNLTAPTRKPAGYRPRHLGDLQDDGPAWSVRNVQDQRRASDDTGEVPRVH